jgi:hypothetical protein
MSQCSFIEMQSSQVAELSQSCLDRIRRRRKEALHEMCEDERNGSLNRFFRWLFRQPLPTDEMIIDSMKNVRFGGVDLVDMLYGRQEDIALRLLKASRYAKVIQVSSDDLAMIG